MSASIVPSIIVKDELLKAARESYAADPGRLKWYRCGDNTNWLPEVPDGDWDPIHRTVMLEGVPIGFMFASVDRHRDAICQLGAVSFRPGSVAYTRALLRFVDGLLRTYRYVRWSVMADNPARRIWASYAERRGGAQVGLFPMDYRTEDGDIQDSVWFQIPGAP